MSNLFCWKSKWTQNVDIVWWVLDSISQEGKVSKSWKTWEYFVRLEILQKPGGEHFARLEHLRKPWEYFACLRNFRKLGEYFARLENLRKPGEYFAHLDTRVFWAVAQSAGFLILRLLLYSSESRNVIAPKSRLRHIFAPYFFLRNTSVRENGAALFERDSWDSFRWNHGERSLTACMPSLFTQLKKNTTKR